MGGARNGVFNGYSGSKRWEVSHQVYGRCYVRAPDADAAIVAAAQVWKTAWTALDFYDECRVSYMGSGR